ncbi:OmpA family protein [Burkholderia pyrrocinia]|uniref:OmpA family protein n=1 Tax=Burkholderia pyrrocinia TaxID=60550 RepID=UPI001BD0D171|nr:OmpA family protein [Burkholderia pyrrocinia]QVN21301.1 OmpA family protein [Burkholderia pyrrocinia]
MKTIDLVQAVTTTFAHLAREQVSAQIGLAPDVVHNVIERSTAALTASLIEHSRTPQGLASAFGAIMSTTANPRIAEQLGSLVAGTAGLKELEASGTALSERATQRRIAVLSDPISMQTGVPPQATHVLAALASAVACGLIKYQLLLDQGAVNDLAQLLRLQIPSVAPFMTDEMAQCIGFASAREFIDSIELPTVAPDSKEAGATPAYRPVNAPVSATVNAATTTAPRSPATSPASLPQQAVVSSKQTAATPVFSPKLAPKTPPVETAGEETHTATPQPEAAFERKPQQRRRRSGRGMTWLLLLLAVGAAAAFAYAQTHQGFQNLTLSSTAGTQQASTPAQSASSAVVDSMEQKPAAPDKTSSSSSSSSSSSASAAPPPGTASAPVMLTDQNAVEHDAVADSAMAMRVDGAGVPHIFATVANDEQRQKLINLLNDKFVAGHFDADVTITPGARADWLEHVDALLSLVTVHDAELALRSRAIELAGPAAEGQRGWIARLQQAFGSQWQVSAFDAATSVGQATQVFRRELAKTVDGGHPCTPSEVARVLNLQVIDFARSSGHVPASAKENLDDAALLLKTCANVGHPIKFEIAAFTDNAGDAQALLQLSQKRADAVRAHLVGAGVPAALLTSKGYGADRPLANNLTSIGRFANRRVEFISHE